MTIVKDLTPVIGVSATIVRPSVLWVTIISKASLVTKLFGVVLAALSIYHARGIWISLATWTMHHALGYGLEKLGMCSRIRDLGRDYAVHICRSANLGRSSEKYEEMHMRQATLLKFHSVDQTCYLSKEPPSDLLE
jgi:hypothetical protein